jgi:6-pyruvoyl-tetrahydropterin synthase
MTMYKLAVREHIMIAHSFRGPIFGPAQAMHGATYIVDAEFARPFLDKDGLVIDIGMAGSALKEVLAPLNYQNLDLLPQFAGINTTTEFLCKHIHDILGAAVRHCFTGGLKITLSESHVAWASYEGAVTQ